MGALADEGTVDNGDGTYSYEAAVEYQGVETKTVGALELTLKGAARYAYEPNTDVCDPTCVENDDDAVYVSPEIDGSTPIESIVGQTIIDADHLEWEITSVDEEAAAQVVSEYDAWVQSESSGEVEGDASDLLVPGTWDPTKAYDLAQGLEEEPGYEIETSYTRRTCRLGSSSGPRSRTWRYSNGGEDYAMVSADVSANGYEFAPVVYLQWSPPSGNGKRCSGTLFDDDLVLTAAHCVFDKGSNTNANMSDVTVTQFPFSGSGTFQIRSANVIGLEVSQDYKSKHQLRYDWAVLKIDASWGTGAQFMSLSSASDSRLNGWSEHRSAGYPAAQWDTTPPSGAQEWRDSNRVCWNTLWLHAELDGDMDALRNRSIKLDIHHVQGQSGGPMYYSGSNPGGRWYITGVNGGHFTSGAANDSLKGPKVPYWKTTILNTAAAL